MSVSIYAILLLKIRVGLFADYGSSLPTRDCCAFANRAVNSFLRSHRSFDLFRRVTRHTNRVGFLEDHNSHAFFPPIGGNIRRCLHRANCNSMSRVPTRIYSALIGTYLVSHSVLCACGFSRAISGSGRLSLPLVVVASKDIGSRGNRIVDVVGHHSTVVGTLGSSSISGNIMRPISEILIPGADLNSRLLRMGRSRFRVFCRTLGHAKLVSSLTGCHSPSCSTRLISGCSRFRPRNSV